MDLTGSKILAMCLLGGISIFLGFIPLKLGKLFKGSDGSPRHGTVFSGLLCFGGGVLLGTSLLHLLPEVIKIYNYLIKTNRFLRFAMHIISYVYYVFQVRENFEHAEILSGKYEHIPLGEVILMIGFFLIYFIEEFVHYLCDSDLHVNDHDHVVEQQIDTKRRRRSVGIHR